MPSAVSASYRGPGLRVRFASINGVTKQGVLEDPLYLPVTLGEFSFSEDFDHVDYVTIGAGEFSVPGPGPSSARRLRSLDQLEWMTVDWHAYARFLTNPHISPEDAREAIQTLARARTPFELLATLHLGVDPEELRMNATIRSLTRGLRPRERDTRYYVLQLKEWRDNSLRRRAHGSGGRGGLPTTHRLTATDSLYSLAKHYYRSSAGWRLIADANGIKSWGPKTPLVRSRRFKVGDKVKIPEQPAVGTLVPGSGRFVP